MAKGLIGIIVAVVVVIAIVVFVFQGQQEPEVSVEEPAEPGELGSVACLVDGKISTDENCVCEEGTKKFYPTNEDGGEVETYGCETQEPEELPPVKEFSVTAKRWDFDPGVITVNEGDMVKMSVRSIDVSHGIAISQFGVSERLSPGETVDIEFTADKAGTYSFFCTVPCGSGHGSMRGTLIVEP